MAPTVAVVMLCAQCNMRCSFCVTEDAMGSFPFDRAAALLNLLKAEGFKSVVIGGGEPLAWPGIFELTDEAKSRGFVVQLGTNGILLPSGFEHIESIDRFVIPLDGSTADVHNAVRFYHDRHFEIVTERLARLRDARKSTTVSTVVTQVNRNDIENIAPMLAKLNRTWPFIHAWHLYQFVPEGRGGAVNRESLHVDPSEYHAITDGVKRMNLGFTVFKRPDMLHSKSVEFFWMTGGRLHRQLGENTRVESP